MFRRYREYRKDEFIIVFADCADGGGDNCAAQFLSATHLDIPTVYHSPESATVMTPLLHDELREIARITGIKPVVAYERNNGGSFEMERLARLNRMFEYRIYTMKVLDTNGKLVDSAKLGWDTNSATRPKMLQDGKEMIDGQLVVIYDEQTITELFAFVRKKKPSGWKIEADDSAHDDLVMALLGVWQLYQTEKPQKSGGLRAFHDPRYAHLRRATR